MSCGDCCSPFAYTWLTPITLFGYGDWSEFGLGNHPALFRGYPPLLGTGGTTVPKQSDWVCLSSSTSRSFGILADGSLWGWGSAPLGDGTLNGSPFPKKISPSGWKKVVTCSTHTLAIKTDGSLWAWGSSDCCGTATATDVSLQTTPRACLSTSIESIRIDPSNTIEWRWWQTSQSSNLQPTSCTLPNNYGTGAAFSCKILYSITSLAVSEGFYYIFGSFKETPTITVTPAVGDNDISSHASVSATLGANGQISRLSITSGGYGYTKLPTMELVGIRPNGSEYRSPILFGMRSQEFLVEVTSGGSGYTHTISNQIPAMISFQARSDERVGYAVLSPGSVSFISHSGEYCNASTGTYSMPELQVISPYGSYSTRNVGLSVTASLVSHSDTDIPLSVEADLGGNGVYRVTLPSPAVARKSVGIVRVTFGSVTDSEIAVDPPYTHQSWSEPGSGWKPKPTSWLNPYYLIDGDAESLASTGRWSVVDTFSGDTLVTCNSLEPEEYEPYEEPWIYGGLYQKGPPLHPLEERVVWGKSSPDGSGYSPEFTSVRSFPSYTQWVDIPMHGGVHVPPETPPLLTLLTYSNNVGGEGFELSSEWESEGNPNGDIHKERFSLSYTIENAGEGYIFEPTVFVTAQFLSPRQVGSRTDWTDVCCSAERGLSAGVAGGKPLVWEGSTSGNFYQSRVATPTRLGFGLDIKYSSKQDSPFHPDLTFFGADRFSSSAIKPQTIGSAFSGFSGTFLGHREWTSRATYDPYSYLVSHKLLGAGANYNTNIPQSCFVGITRGLYKLSYASLPSGLNLPEGNQGYQLFVPYNYDRTHLTPIYQANGGTFYGGIGACYTSAPQNIGSGLSATLYAPESFDKIFFYGSTLYGISGEGHLWFLKSVGGFRRPLPSPDAAAEDFSPQDKVMLKSLSIDKTVTWEWETETEDVSLVYINQYAGETTPTHLSSYSHTYLLPPTRSVSGSDDYQDAVSVYPATIWKVVMTNAGSGYKPSDSLTFTIVGGAMPVFKRNWSFEYDSHEMKQADTEVATLRYTEWQFGVGTSGPLSFEVSGTQLSRKPYPSKLAFTRVSNPTGGPWPLEFSVEKDTSSQSYVSKLTCKLKDEYICKEQPLADYVLGSTTGFTRQAYTIADGGVYLDDHGGQFNAFTTDYSQLASAEAGWLNPYGLYSQIPSVVITGGSGTGAAAKLVPLKTQDYAFSRQQYSAQGSYSVLNRPFNVSASLQENGISTKDGSVMYAVLEDGTLKSHQNPLVPVPPSYPSGFDEFAWPLARTDSGDLYCFDLNHNNNLLQRPTLVPSVEFVIDEPGRDFTMPPLITVDQPSSDIAVVEANLDGKLVSLGVDFAGSGYRTPPTLTLSGGDGVGAEAEAVISGPIDLISVDSGGSGYKAAPKVVFQNCGVPAKASASVSGSVSSIVVASQGDGYADAPEVVISGGGGSGAAAVARMKGRVKSIKITNRAGTYLFPPTVTVSGNATATAVVRLIPATQRYYVSSITVTDGGSEYEDTATVTVSSEAGAYVTAVASMSQYVESVEVTAGGAGYASAPAVTLSGTCRSQASAAAFVDMTVESVSVVSGGEYRQPPTVSFEPVGTLASVAVQSGGGGYETPPDVVVVDARGLGSGASATCRLNKNGQVSSVIVTAVGSGYDPDYPPLVLFVGGGGNGASAVATVEKSGEGAYAGCRINGSILFARPTNAGSGYQFSPTVTISGGDNEAAAIVESQFQAGEISQEEYDELIKSTRGVIQARIEGKVSSFTIVNAGDRYAKLGSGVEVDGVGLNMTSSTAYLSKWGGDVAVTFEAPTSYPGGPISQPSAMPTALFSQKPRVRFVNSTAVDVQEYKQAIVTSCGLKSGSSGSGPQFERIGVSAIELAELSVWWEDAETGWYQQGLEGIRFERPPTLRLASSGGHDAVGEVTIDGDGFATGITWPSSGGGYSVTSKLSLSEGVPRHEPCVASCVVNESGSVVSVTISSPGGSYFAPAAVIHGGGGSGAVVYPVRSTPGAVGEVIRFEVASGGSGYSSTSPPSVLVYETVGLFENTSACRAINSTNLPYDSLFSNSNTAPEYGKPVDHYTQSAGTVISLMWQDFFGVLTEAVSLTQYHPPYGYDAMDFSKGPYQSPPDVQAIGPCKSQIEVSASLAKWDAIFANPTEGFANAVRGQ